MLDYSKSFIETQFPVSKISKESYKERKANLGQTLTGLGKWWGRKPLILVRATLLGVLLPVTDDPVKDRDIFLKILTMDEDGLWLRKSKSISAKDVFRNLNRLEQAKYFTDSSSEDKPVYISGLQREEKAVLQKLVFNRLSYDEKLTYCERPENVVLDDAQAWQKINEHLQTNASSLQELTKQLGEKRFGHMPRVGDCFAGGGSIPFEAARMGAEVYASDLNPVAALLTWASLNIAGASDEEVEKLKNFQHKVYDEVDKQITTWGIEHNEKGHRADAYLYCNETVCPECGYKVPLAPSWVIGKGTKTVALLSDNANDGFEINIVMGATAEQFKEAVDKITIKDEKMYCPHCHKETPITSLRDRDNYLDGLRKWNQKEFIPRVEDVFQERLYALRYVSDNGRYYTAPSEMDLQREKKVISIVTEYFTNWQMEGYIPSSMIEVGDKTDEPVRTRGWHYWHQLFTPRQLIVTALFSKYVNQLAVSQKEFATGTLGLNKITDWNSKLARWDSAPASEKVAQTFSNQALNTMYNFPSKGMLSLKTSWFFNINNTQLSTKTSVFVQDARIVEEDFDCVITDPPYADAVNYHELTEFFLAWDKNLIEKAFPDWYTDSKRVLAVKGVGDTFNTSMVEIYRNLANHMQDNGYQIVMFTHQDVKVWSELAMILWSAGLRVVSAWNIATETATSGLKTGNYVSGTVVLILKRQQSIEMAFQDELYDEIKCEVKSIIDSMKDLNDKDDPDFTDADYLLASYAASLKVLTAYKEIEGIDVKYWLAQSRDSKEINPVEALINKAVKVAYDYLIPVGFDTSLWKDLEPEERFFIRGLEIEMNGSHKISSYQELARGFGVTEYKDMFADFKANSARLKTPSEFRMSFINGDGFGATLTRHLLVAINETTQSQSTVEGRNYLKNVYQKDNAYWYKKQLMIELLSFISKIEYVSAMEHWKDHAYSAKILREALKNEGV